MWIKWKYNDHGHPDFKEVEIPDNLDGEETVPDYICERGWVPTWSERFMKERIKWQRISRPSPNTVDTEIESLKSSIKYKKKELARLKELRKTL
jgi:hypothetical protein